MIKYIFIALTILSHFALAAKKPNILIFLADDHSTFDVGCYGNKIVRTPNIDKLATEGMKFHRAFTSTAMCAPARSMLYTGLYPHRNGAHMNHGAATNGVKSFGQYFRSHGYKVVLAGKGHIKPMSVFKMDREPETAEAISKIINSPQPFCLIIASNDPHAPHKSGGFDPKTIPIPPYLPDTPETRSTREGYYTDIEIMDKAFGSYLKILQESGKADNTITIFLSDHGAGKLAKWTLYEIGLRVPMIIRWPGKIKSGSQNKAMVNLIDILPTLYEASTGNAISNIDGKSFLKTLISKESDHREFIFGAHTNRGIMAGMPFPIRSVRDKQFKYIRNLNSEGISSNITTHNLEYKPYGGGWMTSWEEIGQNDKFWAHRHNLILKRPAEELYDLETDPWEFNNLAQNSQYDDIKESLKTKLTQWMQNQNDLGMKSELSVKAHSKVKK
ncbi:sulfatase [Lentisphaera marina]|uniref:sulfatase family protein n=1 Tax=Lentisphaera marina TaxID=1111041 RepID=UPI0023666281|nr:sulfatase [Lentisphaera marina]MDD7984301.1 sulfatase [Lentisphaera marina]